MMFLVAKQNSCIQGWDSVLHWHAKVWSLIQRKKKEKSTWVFSMACVLESELSCAHKAFCTFHPCLFFSLACRWGITTDITSFLPKPSSLCMTWSPGLSLSWLSPTQSRPLSCWPWNQPSVYTCMFPLFVLKSSVAVELVRWIYECQFLNRHCT